MLDTETIFSYLGSTLCIYRFVHCCDFSKRAVQHVKEHDDYDEQRCNLSFIHAVGIDIDVGFDLIVDRNDRCCVCLV